ncbi:MAG TPA: hypothetical protein PKA27_06595 [Fimbriimonadaceae bacterium]|nr:hypothetical protein [Fimbriimonadaceae bacterium]
MFSLAVAPLLGLSVTLASGSGLEIQAGGVPISTGSWFQYYEPGWSKGYYSSKWNSQTVVKRDNGFLLTFKSGDGLAHGTQSVAVEGNRVTIEYSFGWNGPKPVNVEVCAAMLWAPAWSEGSLGTLKLNEPLRGPSPESRTLSNSTSFQIKSPFGFMQFNSSSPWLLFDARGYNQEWAGANSLFWLGKTGLAVQPGQIVRESFVIAVNARTKSGRAESVKLETVKVRNAFEPSHSIQTLVPKPKQSNLDYSSPVFLNSLGIRNHKFSDFESGVLRRWRSSLPLGKVVHDRIDPSGRKSEGYSINISKERIEVVGHDEMGLRHGLRRLASLTFLAEGKLALPSGTLQDWPSISWRGAHLFVGPRADEFQKRLWTTTLLDLGFNNVVLQCERTKWDAIPGTETSITMDKRKLAGLVNWYRDHSVEPTPLVQSFGHMEWLFANGKNRDLAFNPEVLYSVDPRVPRTTIVLEILWNEVIELFKPKAIHFGLDEVDMRGWPDDPRLVTELWGRQLGFLGSLAKRKNVEMMLWGDKALAPGEAPDAAHGDNATEAQKRRAAIPKGALITDWHYKADPRPEVFAQVLRLWKSEGYRPIASTWNRPENIRGFTLAAIRERAGTLQTTWAGYESGENSLLNHFNQYAAFVVAAEYAWSGREDSVSQFGYDPEAYLQRSFFGQPKPMAPLTGLTLGKIITRLGEYRVGNLNLRFQNILAQGGDARPSKVSTRIQGKGNELLLFMRTTSPLEFGSEVAKVTVANRETAVRYGHHVRAISDTQVPVQCESVDGWSVIRVPTKTENPSIEIQQTQAHAGLEVLGFLLLSS